MKYLSLIFLSLILFAACSSDDTMMPPAEEDEFEVTCEAGCLSAVVNGETFTAEVTAAVKSQLTLPDSVYGGLSTDFLDISGTIPSLGVTQIIRITFACFEFNSELTLGEENEACGLTFGYTETNLADIQNPIFGYGETGIVVIEYYDGAYIKGSFTFTAKDQNDVEYTITEGQFEAPVSQ